MDQLGSEGFYITLPSNASANVFKKNTSSSYQVDLAQHLDLEGRWQVALTEISYPHTWFNLPIEKGYFEWREKPKGGVTEIHRQRIRGGYYSSLNQLMIEMNAFLKKIGSDIQLTFSSIQKRFEFQAGGQVHLRFFPPLAYMLGMKPGEWLIFDSRMAPLPADLRAGTNKFFVYSDLVSPQLVGDAYAPLLRIVDVKGTYGDVVTQYFNPPYYLPVAKNHIEKIHIEIKTDQNTPVNFTFGKTIVKLHFRPAAK